jgi:2-phospho-L-lactate guanylyltransferase
MKPVAVIPVKPRNQAKSRLADALTPDARAALSDRLFARVLGAALAAGLETVVISRDETIRAAAVAAGARALDETSADGLNPALGTARDDIARGGGAALLVLPADLPDVTIEDVRALVAAVPDTPAVVIAPDESGTGTNALLLAPPRVVPFRFGADSFALHCAAARAANIEPVVLRRPGLAFDVDTPDQLARLESPASG